MSIAGIAVIVSLLGIISARQSSSTEPEPPSQARVRLATPEQLAALQLAMSNREQTMSQSGRRVLLDHEPGGGGISGCLAPALRTVGIDWSTERYQGFLGFSYDFSMTEEGGFFWQGTALQWSIFWPMLDHLPVKRIEATLKGPNDTPEKHQAAKRRGWDAVREELDAGRLAIVWSPMTAEQRWAEEPQGPLPWMWSLIVGYDDDAGTITVRHDHAGESTIRFDELGHADPSGYFCVMILDAPAEPMDELAANRQSLQLALAASRGKYPGSQEPATHGLAAYEVWRAALQAGTGAEQHVPYHATYLTHRREEATRYLAQVEHVFPEAARSHVRAAAQHYRAEVDAMKKLREMFEGGAADQKEGAALVNKALEHERAALAEIQRALDAS